jgi:hypothetical protein
MSKVDVDRRALLAGVGGVIAGSVLARRAQAAPPPKGGPVAADLLVLQEKVARTDQGFAEPRVPVQSLPGSVDAQFEITQAGSYYLTQNIQGVAGKAAIAIRASNVDLDLGGFHVVGAVDATGTAIGTGIVGKGENISVFDGSLLGWAVGADFQGASRFLLWDVVSLNAGHAGFLLGDLGQCYDCDVYATAGVAFSCAGEGTLVEECGVWSSAVGFSSSGLRNLFLSNCATQTGKPFDLGKGNAWGPIVVVASIGDISAAQGSDHPSANLVY